MVCTEKVRIHPFTAVQEKKATWWSSVTPIISPWEAAVTRFPQKPCYNHKHKNHDSCVNFFPLSIVIIIDTKTMTLGEIPNQPESIITTPKAMPKPNSFTIPYLIMNKSVIPPIPDVLPKAHTIQTPTFFSYYFLHKECVLHIAP